MKKTLVLIALLLAFAPGAYAEETSDNSAEPVSFIGSWGAPEDSSGGEGFDGPPPKRPFGGGRFDISRAAEYDTDGDGALSDSERETMQAAIKAEMETKKAEMLTKYDTDGDGKLSETEKKAMHEARKAEMEAKKAAMEAKYDADGNGTLSDTEKQAMHEARKTEMQSQVLKKFDTDGDGTLSDTEKAAMESARPQKGERGMGKGLGKGGPRPGMKNRR